MRVIYSFILIAILGAINASAQPNQNVNRDPAAVKFITTDIDNFWRAFDLASKETDKARKAAIYQAEYFDKGNPGLRDFIQLRLKNAESFVESIERLPRFYASARKSTLQAAKLEKKFRRSFRKFKQIYPDAVFPDVYFLVGNTSTGGTTGKSGLLIGTELYSRSGETPMGELPAWMKIVLKPVTTLPAIVAHESCHYNQHLARGNDVLAKSLQEGSCDVIGELISGDIINTAQHIYGNSHESELWQQFRADMNTDKVRNWMYNGVTSKDRPGDLGYFVGYKIARAYYDRAKNKRQAVKDILEIKDFQKFFEASGYDPSRVSAGLSRK